jgi:hypothetical protein
MSLPVGRMIYLKVIGRKMALTKMKIKIRNEEKWHEKEKLPFNHISF